MNIVPSPVWLPPAVAAIVEVSYDGHVYYFRNTHNEKVLEMSKDYTRQNNSMWIAHIKERLGRRLIMTNEYVPERKIVDFVISALDVAVTTPSKQSHKTGQSNGRSVTASC